MLGSAPVCLVLHRYACFCTGSTGTCGSLFFDSLTLPGAAVVGTNDQPPPLEPEGAGARGVRGILKTCALLNSRAFFSFSMGKKKKSSAILKTCALLSTPVKRLALRG